ncbi:MAG: ribosome silencing factor [Desulfobacula sp.]|nr:ribosome silencing factor [Desulfobacula sp.]
MNTPHLAPLSKPLSDSLKKYLIPIFERKATCVIAIDVSEFTSYADTLVVVEARSNRQVRSIAEHVMKEMRRQKITVIGSEGVKKGEWALLDYGDAILHIFETKTKSLYDLEGFWADAPRIDLSEFDHTHGDQEDDDDGF